MHHNCAVENQRPWFVDIKFWDKLETTKVSIDIVWAGFFNIPTLEHNFQSGWVTEFEGKGVPSELWFFLHVHVDVFFLLFGQ